MPDNTVITAQVFTLVAGLKDGPNRALFFKPVQYWASITPGTNGAYGAWRVDRKFAHDFGENWRDEFRALTMRDEREMLIFAEVYHICAVITEAKTMMVEREELLNPLPQMPDNGMFGTCPPDHIHHEAPRMQPYSEEDEDPGGLHLG